MRLVTLPANPNAAHLVSATVRCKQKKPPFFDKTKRNNLTFNKVNQNFQSLKKTVVKKVITIICLFSTTLLFCQNDKDGKANKTIDVTGVAEMSIPPNMIVFNINLMERIDGKEKLTIDKQELNLKEELSAIGIDIQKDLKIVDLSSAYVSQKRKKDVTIGNKDYRLTITDMSKIGKIQDLADRLRVNRLDLMLATNTDLPKYRKETKIAAIKNAKEKAEYLLTAIGEKLGKAIFVQETSDYKAYARHDLDPFRGNSFQIVELDVEDKELGIKDILIKFSIFVKFEIE
jgi:uncharacterized protein